MIEAPTTQEHYARAVLSSSLRVKGEGVRGDADMLIAAGWCKSKFGAALMRLQAEWDGAERWGVKVPVKPTKRAIMTEAQIKHEPKTETKDGVKRTVVVRRIKSSSMEAARLKLEKRYESEMRKVVSALKSLPEVAQHLQIKLLLDGKSGDLAAPLLLYWLDPRCRACGGTGIHPKSEKGCGKCREHPGFAPAPGGESGKGVLHYLDDCFKAAGGDVRDYCRY